MDLILDTRLTEYTWKAIQIFCAFQTSLHNDVNDVMYYKQKWI